MAPNTTNGECILEEPKRLPTLVAPQADSWQFKVSYFNVVAFSYWHAVGLYGLYLCFTSACWPTVILCAILTEASILGTLVGAHRLWSHKSFKVKLPLQIILVLFQTLSTQFTVFNWVRDHRMHHRYSDTDADPHNATRGFFFSHIGWLLVQKHPEVHKRGVTIDMSDITNDPILTFQRKYALIIFPLICYGLPIVIPMYFWGETFNNAYHVNVWRIVLCLNRIFLVNSAAHAFGNRPYDKSIVATESKLAMLSLGEGYHNYHHVFPWDYGAAELGSWVNLPKVFIDFFAWIGWAYDMKTVDQNIVVNRAKRCGDGTYYPIKKVIIMLIVIPEPSVGTNSIRAFMLHSHSIISKSSQCTSLTSCNECRKELFSYKDRQLENIPPTEASFRQHLLRAVYQGVHVWGQAMAPMQNLPRLGMGNGNQ